MAKIVDIHTLFNTFNQFQVIGSQNCSIIYQYINPALTSEFLTQVLSNMACEFGNGSPIGQIQVESYDRPAREHFILALVLSCDLLDCFLIFVYAPRSEDDGLPFLIQVISDCITDPSIPTRYHNDPLFLLFYAMSLLRLHLQMLICTYILESEYMSHSEAKQSPEEMDTQEKITIQEPAAGSAENNKGDGSEPCNEDKQEDKMKAENGFVYQYEHIADRMLRQLQDEYWEVQKHNIGASNKQEKQKQESEEEQEPPEGYINLDNDNDGDHNLNSASEEDEEDEEAQGQTEIAGEQLNVEIQQLSIINTDISNIEEFGQQKETINPETKQLVEVGPVPDSLFEVPPPVQTTLTDVECGKIKNFALSLYIETPEWAKDPVLIKQKIRKLFQNPTTKESLPGVIKFSK